MLNINNIINYEEFFKGQMLQMFLNSEYNYFLHNDELNNNEFLIESISNDICIDYKNILKMIHRFLLTKSITINNRKLMQILILMKYFKLYEIELYKTTGLEIIINTNVNQKEEYQTFQTFKVNSQKEEYQNFIDNIKVQYIQQQSIPYVIQQYEYQDKILNIKNEILNIKTNLNRYNNFFAGIIPHSFFFKITKILSCFDDNHILLCSTFYEKVDVYQVKNLQDLFNQLIDLENTYFQKLNLFYQNLRENFFQQEYRTKIPEMIKIIVRQIEFFSYIKISSLPNAIYKSKINNCDEEFYIQFNERKKNIEIKNKTDEIVFCKLINKAKKIKSIDKKTCELFLEFLESKDNCKILKNQIEAIGTIVNAKKKYYDKLELFLNFIQNEINTITKKIDKFSNIVEKRLEQVNEKLQKYKQYKEQDIYANIIFS